MAIDIGYYWVTKTVGYTTQSNSFKFPNMVFFTTQDQNLQSISSDTVMTIGLMDDEALSRDKEEGSVGVMTTISQILKKTISSNGQAQAKFIEAKTKWPKYFKMVATLKGLKAIHEFLFKNAQISDFAFEKIFKTKPPIDKGYFELVDNIIKVWISPNVQPKELYLNRIRQAHKILQEKKLAYLIEQRPIRIKKIKAGDLGWYDTETGELAINEDASKFDGHNMVKTIIHEYGHRLEYEFFSVKQKQMLSDMYFESMRILRNDKAYADQKRLAQIMRAKVITYVGKNPDNLSDGPYHYLEHDRNTVTIASVTKRGVAIKGPYNSFFNFKFDGEDPYRTPNDMFITDYAQTDEHEFLCETFAFWAIGQWASTDAKLFIETLIKPNQKG
jgi:hypothetical protein